MHWRRKWHPTPVFLPGESRGWGSLLGCRSMGSHRVGHYLSDLAAAAAAAGAGVNLLEGFLIFKYIILIIDIYLIKSLLISKAAFYKMAFS